jgi:uncharacterized oxidoreductase
VATIADEKLAQLGTAMMVAAGAAPDVAQRVVQHLVNANLVGVDSHGIIRLTDYVSWLREGKAAPDDRIEVLNDQGATAWLDAHLTFGPVAASRAAQMAADKARTVGMGIVSVKNATHIGRLGEYAYDLAAQGLVGFVCCNAQGAGQVVAPWGGTEGRLTTNPLAWGFPTGRDQGPLVMDMATSAWPEGKVRVKYRRNEKVPPGVLIDADGRESTDPHDFYDSPCGALLPAGLHKGYALGLMVEFLSGVLSGGGCSRGPAERFTHVNSFCVMAINIESVRSLEDIIGDFDAVLAWVKSSPPTRDGGEVLVPYEPETRRRQQILGQGIEVEHATWDSIVELAESLGVTVDV